MEIFEELNAIYNDLRAAGVVRTKKELADRLGISDKGMIKGMKGDPNYATPSLRTKFMRFRDENLPPSPSAGPSMEELMNKALDNMHDAQQIAKRAQDATDRLIALLENHLGVTVMPGIGVGKKFEIEK